MKLRSLRWQGFAVWPPQWIGSQEEQGSLISGEEGVLTDVELIDGTDIIRVEAEYGGTACTGLLYLDNPGNFQRLQRLLEENIGKTLAEIGNLEMDF
jgi:hypothetical protein